MAAPVPRGPDAGPQRRARSHPRLDDGEWLREQYVHRGRPSKDIGLELGVTGRTVLLALRAAGIETRGRGRPRTSSPVDGAWLREQYEARCRTTADLGRELGRSEDWVIAQLRDAGIEVRSRGGGRPHAQMPLQLRDALWLHERYIDRRKSVREIAAELNVSSRAVWAALVRANVPRRNV